MYRQISLRLFYSLLLLVGAVTFTSAALAGTLAQDINLPPEGWQVCLVGGIETIPGVSDARQVFEMCHADGWRLQAYCLEPGIPVPLDGAICSLLDGDRFWCGEGVQVLSMYGILETPSPRDTSTATATLTPTVINTATPTMTATRKPTSVVLTSTPDQDRVHPGGMGSLEPFLAGLGIFLAMAGVLTWKLLRCRA